MLHREELELTTNDHDVIDTVGPLIRELIGKWFDNQKIMITIIIDELEEADEQ